MRVSKVRLHWVQIPFHEPFRISNGEASVKEAILVELASDNGNSGWGEASPMAGSFYSKETPESTWKSLCGTLVPSLLANPDLDFGAPGSDWLTESREEPFARAGMEGALWDLIANAQSRPLCEFLGGCPRPIPSGAAIGLMSGHEELLDRVGRFRAHGYRRIKIKIEPGQDVGIVRAVRERFGDIPLMVDANAAYRLEDVPIFDELDQLGLIMIEQPLAREALEEHAELQRRLQTPLCLDESAEDVASVGTIIRLGSARILNIKVQRMGGLWRAQQAHDMAQKAGLPCWVGTMPELGIASAQALCLATLENFTFPTDIEASERWFVDDIIVPPIEISPEGLIHLPAGPGMGYRVDPAKVARYRIRLEEFRG